MHVEENNPSVGHVSLACDNEYTCQINVNKQCVTLQSSLLSKVFRHVCSSLFCPKQPPTDQIQSKKISKSEDIINTLQNRGEIHTS